MYKYVWDMIYKYGISIGMAYMCMLVCIYMNEYICVYADLMESFIPYIQRAYPAEYKTHHVIT